MSDIMRPLTNLTKNTTPFICSPLCQVSFDTIKIVLTNIPILIVLDSNHDYVFYTDAPKLNWSRVQTQVNVVQSRC